MLPRLPRLPLLVFGVWMAICGGPALCGLLVFSFAAPLFFSVQCSAVRLIFSFAPTFTGVDLTSGSIYAFPAFEVPFMSALRPALQ